MIDHVSIPVSDLARGDRFYTAVLNTLGYTKFREKPGTIGYGKNYPDFWINLRPNVKADPDSGLHICLRADDQAAVDAFHAAALGAGGTSTGAPGIREEYTPGYYAAFVRDPDGNKIEAVTFIEQK